MKNKSWEGFNGAYRLECSVIIDKARALVEEYDLKPLDQNWKPHDCNKCGDDLVLFDELVLFGDSIPNRSIVKHLCKDCLRKILVKRVFPVR